MLGDLAVVDMRRQTIAAKDENVAFLRRHLGEIGFRSRPDAERPGQDMTMGMLSGVRLRNFMTPQQLAHDRMIVGQSAQTPLPQ